MMNVMFLLLAKRTFPDVVEDVNSKNFSLAPIACSKLPSFYVNNVIDL